MFYFWVARATLLEQREFNSVNGMCGAIILDMLTSLGQPTIMLRRYRWSTSKEGSLRRKKKNKVEEIQMNNCEASKPRKF